MLFDKLMNFKHVVADGKSAVVAASRGIFRRIVPCGANVGYNRNVCRFGRFYTG